MKLCSIDNDKTKAWLKSMNEKHKEEVENNLH